MLILAEHVVVDSGVKTRAMRAIICSWLQSVKPDMRVQYVRNSEKRTARVLHHACSSISSLSSLRPFTSLVSPLAPDRPQGQSRTGLGEVSNNVVCMIRTCQHQSHVMRLLQVKIQVVHTKYTSYTRMVISRIGYHRPWLRPTLMKPASFDVIPVSSRHPCRSPF